MVPVGYVQGGGFFLSLPLRVGDVVLLVFAERSLDAWIESARAGKQSPIVPGDLSMHTLQGAVALPCGPAPRSGLLQGVDAADLVIGKSDGTILLRLTAAGQAVLVEGTQFVALANLVLDRLNTIQTTFDGHTHPAVTTATVGLAGPATVTVSTPGSTIGALASVAATKTKAT
jgi:Phage protein Gp138 N-terminal domain